MPEPPRTAPPRPALRPLLWLLLGGWIGAMALFGLVLARVVFQVVPDPDVAGRLVGRVLGPLQLSGAAAGLALAALAAGLRRGRLAVVLPLVLAGICLFNHFGVTPRVAEFQVSDPGAAPGSALRFARLHELSVLLFGITASGALLLAGIHALAEARAGRTHSGGPSPHR